MSLAGLLPHGAEDFGDQTEIVLSGRQIDDTVVRAIAEELKTNRTLTVLDLQSNYITAGGAAQLCDALRLNRSLKELGLANNSLGDEGAAELSNLLDTNHTLERISLDNNAISPALMEKVMFKTLLNTQPLAVKLAMPRAFANDPELKELDLSEYEGSRVSCDLITDCLKANTVLVALNVSNLDIGDSGTAALATLVRRNSSIKELNLSNNSITTHGVRDVADALKQNQGLTSLILSQNKVGDDGARALIDVLRHNDSIVSLDVSRSAVSRVTTQALASAVFLNTQPLHLKRCLFQTAPNDESLKVVDFSHHPNMENSARLLCNALKNNRFVTILNFGGVGVGDEGARDLAQVLTVNHTITELGLASNRITLEGGRQIATALTENQTLVDLNLANNHLGDEGAGLFVAVLSINNSIIALNLEQNEVSASMLDEVEDALFLNEQPIALKKVLPALMKGDAGDEELEVLDFSAYDGQRYHTDASVKILCRALIHNKHVKRLSYANNNVGDAGAVCIADVLKTNRKITHLDFSANAIRDRGCLALCEALKQNNTVTKLDLENNNISETGAQALLDVMKVNNVLVEVSLKFNKIPQTAFTDIQIACAINTQPKSLKHATPRIREADQSLTHIDVSNFDGSKYYNDTAVCILAHELKANDTILSLNLANNTFEQTGAEALAEFLAVNSSLTDLNVANNTIGDVGLSHFCTALQTNSTLTSLNITNNQIGDRGIESLLHALALNDSLVICKADRNDISLSLLQQLEDALKLNTQPKAFKTLLASVNDNDPTLKVLDLSEREDDRYYNDTTCKLLASALLHNQHIVELRLQGNTIGPKGAGYLADALEDNRSIRKINLNGNRIKDEGVMEIARALKVNDVLEAVWTDHNSVSLDAEEELTYRLMLNSLPKSFKATFDRLTANDPTLSYLDYSQEPGSAKVIDDAAMRLIATNLLVNSHVTLLDLSHNRITAQGAAYLEAALRHNTVLCKLNIAHNLLGDAGGRALARAMKQNGTLSYLNVTGNGISPDIVEDIHAAVKINAHQPPSGPAWNTPTPSLRSRTQTPGTRPSSSKSVPFADLTVYDEELAEVDDHFYSQEHYNSIEQMIFEDAMKDQNMLLK
jgi:Ran GTPase-activating protein (RanGAP) involved in mRNA processing and transport